MFLINHHPAAVLRIQATVAAGAGLECTIRQAQQGDGIRLGAQCVVLGEHFTISQAPV